MTSYCGLVDRDPDRDFNQVALLGKSVSNGFGETEALKGRQSLTSSWRQRRSLIQLSDAYRGQ